MTFNPVAFLGANASWKSTQGLSGVKLHDRAWQQLSIHAEWAAECEHLDRIGIDHHADAKSRRVQPGQPWDGTYANVLCFADLTSFTDPATSCQQMKLSIANSPDYLQFCVIETPTDTAAPQQVPTYYGFTDGGWDSEAYLGNNGFYTGIAGLPALSQRQQTSLNTPTWPNGFRGASFELTTITFSNIQVVNAVGAPATGWTLVTGDAESTDTNGWLEFRIQVSSGTSFRTPARLCGETRATTAQTRASLTTRRTTACSLGSGPRHRRPPRSA